MYKHDQAMQITVPATLFELFSEQGEAIHNKEWKSSVFPFLSFSFLLINSYCELVLVGGYILVFCESESMSLPPFTLWNKHNKHAYWLGICIWSFEKCVTIKVTRMPEDRRKEGVRVEPYTLHKGCQVTGAVDRLFCTPIKPATPHTIGSNVFTFF